MTRHPAAAIFTLLAQCVLSALAGAQTMAIPVHELSTPILLSTTFGALPAVVALPNGKAVVHDWGAKRILLIDSLLQSFTIVADSTGSSGITYPSTLRSNALLAYVGDSALFVDWSAKTFVVIDPSGKFSKAIAHPHVGDFINLGLPYGGNPAADRRGRLLYRALESDRAVPKSGDSIVTSLRDTIAIVRADFDLRKVDTVARYGIPRMPSNVVTTDSKGKFIATLKVNPGLAGADEWAVLFDGTVAIVREHDYHIDFVDQDGVTSSSEKLPFAWLKLSDAMKQARIDSARAIIDSVNRTARPYGMTLRGTRLPDERGMRTDTIIPQITYAALSEMADYVSPLRAGSVRADRDNNLWIIPTTAATNGRALQYDVVNREGRLFERVRVPTDYVIVGFGTQHLVYLAKYDSQRKCWTLAVSRIV